MFSIFGLIRLLLRFLAGVQLCRQRFEEQLNPLLRAPEIRNRRDCRDRRFRFHRDSAGFLINGKYLNLRLHGEGVIKTPLDTRSACWREESGPVVPGWGKQMPHSLLWGSLLSIGLTALNSVKGSLRDEKSGFAGGS